MPYLNGEQIMGLSNVTILNAVIDQEYNPESENAQSGTAVAEAVADKMDKFGEVDDSDEFDTTVTLSAENSTVFIGRRIGLVGGDGGLFLTSSTGEVDLNNQNLAYVASPIEAHHATNKEYVDKAIENIPIPTFLYTEKEINGTVYAPTVSLDLGADGTAYLRLFDNVSSEPLQITGVFTDGDDDSSAVCVGFLNEKIGDIETALDKIIAIQENLIGGDSV